MTYKKENETDDRRDYFRHKNIIKWRNNGAISGVDSGLNENENAILNVIKTNPSISAKDLSISLSIPFRSVQRYISNLKEKGIIERVGSNKSGYWKVIK